MTLQVSGMLWNRSLVMRDTETKSLWSHILGLCMKGPLEGEELEPIGSVMTTWSAWKKEHPATTVLNLPRTSKNYDKEFYAKPELFVLGVVIEGKARAYPFDVLRKRRVLDDTVEHKPVVVTYDAASTQAGVYSRTAGARTLSFQVDPQGDTFRDRETGSRWSLLSGKAVAGPLKGTQLEALPAIVSYRRAWKIFHPDSSYAGSVDDTAGGG